MDEIRTEQRIENSAQDVEIWYCRGCRSVHLGLGDTRISLDREKFSEFAGMVADVHYDSFSHFGDFDILSAAREIDVEPVRTNEGN